MGYDFCVHSFVGEKKKHKKKENHAREHNINSLIDTVIRSYNRTPSKSSFISLVDNTIV